MVFLNGINPIPIQFFPHGLIMLPKTKNAAGVGFKEFKEFKGFKEKPQPRRDDMCITVCKRSAAYGKERPISVR